MVSKIELETMANMDITKADRCQLADIEAVFVPQNLPAKERLDRLVHEMKNPYCFMSGKTPVKIEFTDEGKPLDKTLSDYFIGLKNR